MDPVKPGWQTTEFWLTALKMLGAFALAAGVVSRADEIKLEGSVAVIVTSVFAIVLNAKVLLAYLESRRGVKIATLSTPAKSVLPFLLAAFLLAGPAQAQSRPAAGVIQPTCFGSNSGSTTPAPNPATTAALAQIASNQQQIIALLTQLAAKQTTTPAPAAPVASPSIVILQPGAASTPYAQGYITIPPPGQPQLTIPPPGQPLLTIPPAGQPLLTIPPAGQPQLTIPPAGQPQLTIPVPGLPASPAPAPVAPMPPASNTPGVLTIPPASGMQPKTIPPAGSSNVSGYGTFVGVRAAPVCMQWYPVR